MQVFSAPTEIRKPEFSDFFGNGRHDFNAYMEADKVYIKAVGDWAVANGDAHRLAGASVSVPYADGAAVYVIGKFAGKVSLIHIDTGDGWRDARFERLATVAELSRIVADQDARSLAFDRMFNRS